MRFLFTLSIFLFFSLPLASWAQTDDPQETPVEQPEGETGEGETETGGEAGGEDAEGLAANPGTSAGCTSFMTGTFQYVSKGRKGIKFKRKRKKQIEINNNTGEKAKYKVEWTSNCDYILIFKKSNQDNKLKKGWTVETSIVETYDEFYGYRADQYGIISEGVIQKILSKGQTRRKARKEKRERAKAAKDEAKRIKEEQERLEEEQLQKQIDGYDEFNNYDPEIAKIIEKRKKEEEKAMKKEDKKKFKEEKWAKKKAEKEAASNQSKDEKKAAKDEQKEGKKEKDKSKGKGKGNIFKRTYDKTIGKLINKFFKKKAKNKVDGELREIGG